MNQDPNPKVRAGQTLLVLLLLFLVISFWALIHYRNGFFAFILSVIFLLMYKLDKKINEIKENDEYKEQRKQMGLI